MRSHSVRYGIPAVLLSLVAGVACRDDVKDTTASDALARDLALAQASSVALAPTARDLPATRFISPLESGERAVAGSGRAPRIARRSPNRAPAAQAGAGAPVESPVVSQSPQSVAAEAEIAPAPAPAVADEAPASGPSAGESATVLPNDGEVTVARPEDGTGSAPTAGRRGRGGIFGGIGGVIIRGGSIGDDDHCERDQPRGGRGGILGGRMPVGIAGPVGYPGNAGTWGVPRSGVGRSPRGGVRY